MRTDLPPCYVPDPDKKNNKDVWGYQSPKTGKYYRIQGFASVHNWAFKLASNLVEKQGVKTRIIDLGSGQGALLQRLIDEGFNAKGTTWNKKCEADETAIYPNINLNKEFTASDVDGQVDMAILLEMIEHVENPASALRTIAKLVKKDGYLILSTPNVKCGSDRLAELLRECPASFDGECLTVNGHISHMWYEQIIFLAARAGFREVDKQLVEPLQKGNGLSGLIKRLIYATMKIAKVTDIHGRSLCLVFERTEAEPVESGPDTVF